MCIIYETMTQSSQNDTLIQCRRKKHLIVKHDYHKHGCNYWFSCLLFFLLHWIKVPF